MCSDLYVHLLRALVSSSDRPDEPGIQVVAECLGRHPVDVVEGDDVWAIGAGGQQGAAEALEELREPPRLVPGGQPARQRLHHQGRFWSETMEL